MACKVTYQGKTYSKDEIESHINDFIVKSNQIHNGQTETETPQTEGRLLNQSQGAEIPKGEAAPSISIGDVVESEHHEGLRKVVHVSDDGVHVVVEDPGGSHIKHEISISDIKPKDNAQAIRGNPGQVQEGRNAPEGSENPRSQDIQLPPEQTPGNGETIKPTGEGEIGGGEPPAPGNPDDLPFGQLPVGIAHDLRVDRARTEFNITNPERGQGINISDSIERGKELIKAGVDPEKVAADFKADKRLSHDDMAVVRARYNELVHATDQAVEKFGKDSQQAKKAAKLENEWYDNSVKPMQTESSKIFTAQQSAVDLDTGSITSFKRAFKESTGKDLTPEQEKNAKDFVEKNKSLNEQVNKLQKKLDDLHGSDQTKGSRKISQQAKKVANTFRKLKTKEFTFKDSSGNEVPLQKMGASWNDLVELGAKAIEKTGEIADGIAEIIDKVKEADWYNGLSENDKNRFEKELTDHYANVADKKAASRIKTLEKQLADLEEGKVKEKGPARRPTEKEQELKDKIFNAKNNLGLVKGRAMPKQPKTPIEPQDIAEKYVNKNDDKFTPAEAKEIWQYTKDKYLDRGTVFPEALRSVATDLGLTSKQALAAIAAPKGAKEITMEMYKKQYERTKALNSAKIFIKTANDSKAKKFFNMLPSVFFNLKTYGHGTVGFLTHAGPNIFRPSVWKAYWPNFFKQYSFAYGNTGKYQMALEGLKNSPHFDEWKKAGLAVDPQTSYDEYQLFGIKQSKLGAAGTKGFNALKFLRYDMAESFYKTASDAEKADPELREHLAELVNHATGHSEVRVPNKLAKVFFAPGLEISRWQRMITDPAIALNTVRTWNKRTPAEQAAAKIVFRGAGEKLATYGTLLAANAGLLAAMGSKQQINLTDPSNSDWLKFKGGDETIDFTGGVLNPIRLLSIITKEAYLSAYGNKQELRTKPGDKDASTITSQARYKLSPLAGSGADILTGTDAMGNPLPWSNVAPPKGRHKIDWTEFAWQQTPIPIAAGAKAAMDGMRERGMSDPEINDIFNGLLHFSVEGFTGVKASPDYSLEKGGSGGGGGAKGNYKITEWK